MVNKKFLSFIFKCFVADSIIGLMEINDIDVLSVVKSVGQHVHFRMEV